MAGFTISEHVDRVGWNRITTLMFVACGLYWLCDAVELGLMSYLIPVLIQQDFPGVTKGALSDAIASIVFAGIVVGALFFGVLSDRIGRKKVFLITAGGTGLFGIASAFSPEIISMLILRFFCGVFLGGGPIAYSLYLEFLPHNKLWIMTFFNLWFTLGTLFEAVLAFLVLPTLGFRWLIALSSAPIVLLCFSFPFIRESLHWLVAVGRKDAYDKELDHMYRFSRKIRSDEVSIVSQVEKGSFSALFRPDYLRRTILLCLIWFCVNLVYYGSVFFATSYFILVLPADQESSGLVLLVLISGGEVVGALISAFLIYKCVPRYLSSALQLIVCAMFLFLTLVTADIYTRAVFILISRAAIFGAFATIYLWTPLVIKPSVRSSAMGLFSSFGKMASIAAPFISSNFTADDILIPAILFGVMALVCASLTFFVGVEPRDLRADKLSDDDTSPLLNSGLKTRESEVLV